MPRKRELSWHKQGRCWRKYRNGKMHYLDPRGVNKTDEESYRLALANWNLKLADLISEENPSLVSAIALADASQYAAKFASNYSKLPKEVPSNGGANGETSLSKLVASYLADRRAEVQAGQISAKMYAEHSAKLADFEAFATHFRRFDINNQDSDLLAAYRREQLDRVTRERSADGISKATARKRLQIVQRFMTWAYKCEALNTLPRVLLSDYAKIKLNPPKPTFYTAKEIRRLFRASSSRLKAAILLACNCGFTQVDVASLTWEMIDVQTRILRRERNKTGVESQWRLWPVTVKALQALSKRSTGLIFLGPRGSLLQQEVSPEGKLIFYDQLFIDFRGLKRKLKLTDDPRSFKHFRKSAANEIAKKFQDKPFLTDQFLSHSIGAVKKHYVAQHFDALLDACDYLENLYALK